jgi:hypothetical protein
VLGAVAVEEVQPQQRVGEHLGGRYVHVVAAEHDRTEVVHHEPAHVVQWQPVHEHVPGVHAADLAGALHVPDDPAVGHPDDLRPPGAARRQLQDGHVLRRGPVHLGRRLRRPAPGDVDDPQSVEPFPRAESTQCRDGRAAGEHHRAGQVAPRVGQLVEHGGAGVVGRRLGHRHRPDAAEQARPQRDEVLGERGGVQDDRVARAEPGRAEAGEGPAGPFQQFRVAQDVGGPVLQDVHTGVPPGRRGGEQRLDQCRRIAGPDVQVAPVAAGARSARGTAGCRAGQVRQRAGRPRRGQVDHRAEVQAAGLRGRQRHRVRGDRLGHRQRTQRRLVRRATVIAGDGRHHRHEHRRARVDGGHRARRPAHLRGRGALRGHHVGDARRATVRTGPLGHRGVEHQRVAQEDIEQRWFVPGHGQLPEGTEGWSVVARRRARMTTR